MAQNQEGKATNALLKIPLIPKTWGQFIIAACSAGAFFGSFMMTLKNREQQSLPHEIDEIRSGVDQILKHLERDRGGLAIEEIESDFSTLAGDLLYIKNTLRELKLNTSRLVKNQELDNYEKLDEKINEVINYLSDFEKRGIKRR